MAQGPHIPPGYGEGADALLAATIVVVARRGLRGLTFRAVAESAGVNNSLIAYHFHTRDELLLAALRWATTNAITTTGLTQFGGSRRASTID